jgi:hypothetical protein
MAQMSPTRLGWTDLRRVPDDPRPPAALVVGLALVAQLAWAALAQALDLPGTVALVAVVGIGVVAAWWTTVPTSILLALTSLLVADGFVQNQLGQLGWNGNQDGLLLLALLVGCAVSAEVRSELIEESRRRRSRSAPAAPGSPDTQR